MNTSPLNRFRARIEQWPLWARFLALPVYFTACAWKMQAVFMLVGALMILKDYAFFRGGRVPQFDWLHSLSTAIIPPLIIPVITIAYTAFVVYRVWSARRRGGSVRNDDAA